MIVLTTRKPEIVSRVLTPGTYTTITLALFKEHLKWDSTDTSEDNKMQSALTSAIKLAEAYTRRVIDAATWQTYLDSFHDFTFDIAPVNAITSVKYYDSSNVQQTLATSFYTFINKGADSYAELEFKSGLPELYDRPQNVVIEFTAGYATYPVDLVDAIMQQAADFFENRTNDLPGSLGCVSMGFHQRLFPYKML
jgi:uncharacterized phiE125 gp8 family phage protein